MKFKYSYEVVPPGLIIPAYISPLGEAANKEIRAKIDTGANISAIPERLRKELSLLPRGFRQARGAFDKESKSRPTFYITLSIEPAFSFELEVISSNSEYFLIGRDVLNQIILHADGKREIFELTK